MNNETTCFLCISSVLVRRCLSFCFGDDKAAFGFWNGEKKAGRSKDSQSQSLCFNAPPPILIWTLPNLPVAPHGLTQSSEQRRSFSSKGRVYFYVQYVFHTWTGEKVPDLFCVWSLFFPDQTCWELFWMSLHLMQSEQSDVQVRRAAVGLCFVALVASVMVSHRFRWTNSELYISSLSWYWTLMFHCVFCAQCKPESDVQIH